MNDHEQSSLLPVKVQTSWRKRVLFACAFLLVIGLSIELLLHLLCLIAAPIAAALEPADRSAVAPVDDDLLGHRPNPRQSDHDSKGFRNAVALERADIVCLGDSQTYGAGVPRDDAWPHQLGASSGRTVYSIAYGGWGPTHSEALLGEAKQLRPTLVIEGVYAGNDLYDCYNMVYTRDRLSYHKSNAAEVEAAILEANQHDPLDAKINELYRVYCGHFGGSVASNTTGMRGFLSTHSRIYGLARAIKNGIQRNEDPWSRMVRIAVASQGKWEVLDSHPFRLIFVPEYRLVALDRNDPRIKEGHRISLDALTNMSRDLSMNRIRFLVVLIPTKMLVFAPQLHDPSAAFSKLVTNEEQMWEDTKAHLENDGIAFLDALPALRETVNQGVQPYSITADGHPNPAGHRAISNAVLQWLDDHEVGESTDFPGDRSPGGED